MKKSIFFLLILLSACSEMETLPPTQQVECQPPPRLIKVGLLDDLSGSAESHPILIASDLNQLTQYIHAAGGIVLFSAIGNVLFHPISLEISSRPNPPAPSKTTGNLYIDNEESDQYRAEMESYSSQFEARERTVSIQIDTWYSEISHIISAPCNHLKSPVWNRVNMMTLALCEPTSTPIGKYLIIISDGHDNQGGKYLPPTCSDIEIIMVSHQQLRDDFPINKNVHLFTSVRSAIAYIVTKEKEIQSSIL